MWIEKINKKCALSKLIVKWRYGHKLEYEVILDKWDLFSLSNKLNIEIYYKWILFAHLNARITDGNGSDLERVQVDPDPESFLKAGSRSKSGFAV